MRIFLTLFALAATACLPAEDPDPVSPTDSPTVAPSGCVEGATLLCACSTGDLGAQVCDADGAFGECDCAEPPTVGGVTFLVEDEDGSTSTGVDTLHIIGETDCIQPLGSVQITNDGTGPADVTLVVDGTYPQIVLDPAGSVSVAAASSATVTITFDCNLLPVFPPDPVSTTVTVSATDDAADAIQFPVVLMFQDGA